MTHATAAAVDTTEISFEEGIIGVPRARRFQLLGRDGSEVLLLRSLDIPGFSLPVVDPRHADPGFTLRTYAHLMPNAEDRARSVVDAALGPRATSPVSGC